MRKSKGTIVQPTITAQRLNHSRTGIDEIDDLPVEWNGINIGWLRYFYAVYKKRADEILDELYEIMDDYNDSKK